LTTKGRTGGFDKKIPVETNDRANHAVTLVLQAPIKLALKADPPIANFGKLDRDASAQTKTITITRGDGGPLSPEITMPKDAKFTATLRPIEPGEKYALDVVIAPPWPNGAVRGQFTVKSGLADAPPQEIHVDAQIAARLAAVPGRYELPRNPPAEVEVKVELQWSGANPGKVTKATVSDPTMKVRIVEENGKKFVALAVPAGFEPKPGPSAAVTVETDDQEVPSLTIQTASAPGREPTLRPAPSLSAPGGVGPPMPAAPATNPPSGSLPPAPARTAPPAK
jgi:hypothetical protein